jgi:hypothetical protein
MQIETILNAKEYSKFDKLVKGKTLNIGDSITITGIRELSRSVIVIFIYKNEKTNAIANY